MKPPHKIHHYSIPHVFNQTLRNISQVLWLIMCSAASGSIYCHVGVSTVPLAAITTTVNMSDKITIEVKPLSTEQIFMNNCDDFLFIF
jgi:hypothetical protein